MSRHIIKTTYRDDSTSIEVSVAYRFTPGDPGILTGPLENARQPSDPEIEVTGVHSLTPPGDRSPDEIRVWAEAWAEENEAELIGKAIGDLAPPDPE